MVNCVRKYRTEGFVKKNEKFKWKCRKYKAYYRDILKNYSPAELSYIDKFEILFRNDVAASLLSLELNKNICKSFHILYIFYGFDDFNLHNFV